jgi:mRNA deadenylase 3'-5' endonuclease subunit Ccr4
MRILAQEIPRAHADEHQPTSIAAMTHTIRVVSYNILADAHIRTEWYPKTPPRLLWWEHRKNRLVKRIREFSAELVCLQEVEPPVFEFLETALKPDGYRGVYAQKGNHKPDGCATFFKTTSVILADYQTIYYSDRAGGDLHSGHLALITDVEINGLAVRAVNTHLKWENKESNHRIGLKQAVELAEMICSDKASRWIVCGDFNAQTGSAVIETMLSKGLIDAYATLPQSTANSNGDAKRIDYIFHSPSFVSEPLPITVIENDTPLPSQSEPSDHLPICARLSFQSLVDALR